MDLILLLKIIAGIFLGFSLGEVTGFVVSVIFGLLISILIGADDFKVVGLIANFGTGIGAIIGIICAVRVAIYGF